jgi:hypothetical protein
MLTINNNNYSRSIRMMDYFFSLFIKFMLNLLSVVYLIPNKEKNLFTSTRDIKNYGKTTNDIPFNYINVYNQ